MIARTFRSALLAALALVALAAIARHFSCANPAAAESPRNLVGFHAESPPLRPSPLPGDRVQPPQAPILPDRPGAAEALFATGLTRNFGTVRRGTQLRYSFPITNTFAVPITIDWLQPSCGCLTAEAAKRHLEPRESATIDVHMDAGRFVGKADQSVRVKIGGPDFESTCKLRVFAVSGADIAFLPRELVFRGVVPGQPSTKTVDVEYTGPSDWRVYEVVLSKDSPWSASVQPLYRRPGKIGYRISVTLKADAPRGTTRALLNLRTNDDDDPLVPFPVVASVPKSGKTAPK